MKYFAVCVFAVLSFGMLLGGCTKDDNINLDPNIDRVVFSAIKRSSAYFSSSFSGIDNAEIVSKGFCISKTYTPDTVNLKTASINVVVNTSAFADTVKGLAYNTRYYVRAYVITSSDTLYSFASTLSTLSTAAYQLGQTAEGGTVFYIDSTGEHGLVASSYDIVNENMVSKALPWWPCDNGNIETGSKIGTGKSNTEFIVTKLKSVDTERCHTDKKTDIAAEACYNLVRDGYDDWFLPSYEELAALRRLYGLFPPGFSLVYWSSSCNGTYPSYVIFTGLASGGFPQSFYWNVRPIRAF